MKLKIPKHALVSFVFTIMLTSCEKDEVRVSPDSIQTSAENQEQPELDVELDAEFAQSKYYLSEDEARSIASTLTFDQLDPVTGKVGSAPKSVKNSKKVWGNQYKEAFYIIEYENSGFVMISADKRTKPILGYSENSGFDLEQRNIPSALLSWLSETADEINSIEDKPFAKKPIDLTTRICNYQKYLGNSGSRCIEEEDECQDRYEQFGPYMNSRWNQGRGFNNFAPNLSCANTGNNRAWIGCVATALGQVMRYHNSPSGYNWGAMPLSNVGSTETSRLLFDVAEALDMDYSCSGSGASTEDGDNVLKNNFGYSSATFSGWSHSTVKGNLRNRRPVILAGHSSSNCFLWWCSYNGGHAWVAEGYRSTFHCSTSSQTTYYYMNWGWGGSYNGYYGYNDWSPGSTNFAHNRRMIYNIRP